MRGAAELRVKESDRIAALVEGLRAMGADADEFADGFEVRGGRRLTGGTVDAHHDHRLAMAFAVAALGATGPTLIHGAEVAAVSFPRFFETLDGAAGVKTDKVYLVGFMGAGKTTVARALARRLDWKVEDIDARIERLEQRDIPTIFRQSGEAYFRALERQRARRSAARARRGRGHRRRHRRRRRQPRADAARRRGGLARCAVRTGSWSESPPTAAGRWPPIAARWNGSIINASRPTSRPTCAWTFALGGGRGRRSSSTGSG